MGAETPKQFLSLDGVPLLLFTLQRLAACPAITEFIIATRAEEVDSVAAGAASANLGRPVRVVRGGDSRQSLLTLTHSPESFNSRTTVTLVGLSGAAFASRRVKMSCEALLLNEQ